MDPETVNEQIVPDEDTERYFELKGKQDRTPEENSELTQLDENYKKSAKDRIRELTSEIKTYRQNTVKDRQEREELQRQIDDLRTKLEERNDYVPAHSLPATFETVKVGKRDFYTDKGLSALVEAGQMTQDAAYAHQQERIVSLAEERAYQRMKTETTEEETKRIRAEDANSVMREYPQFNKNHPDFNPNDPLYKEATELWESGLYANPRGLSLAIKKAKRILGLGDTRPDLSDELGVNRTGGAPPISAKKKEREVTLSQDEERWAIQMYCRGDLNNPATGRPYTEKEAVAKAKNAKLERMKGAE